MSTPPPPTLRSQWGAGETTLGLWSSSPCSITAETLSRAGADYVCIDLQHGLVDYQASVGMIQGILLGGSIPIARVPWNEPGIIGKVLDGGAQGIIVPMVNTVTECESAVRATRYPPEGGRSFGPSAAAPRAAGSYFDAARAEVAVIPMIETAEALGNIDEILAVPGVDAIYVGPADLSISLGLPPGNNDGAPEFDAALDRIVAACAAAGVVPGIHSTGSLTPRRLAAGFRMVTVTADLVAMRAGIAAELAKARSAEGGTGTDALY